MGITAGHGDEASEEGNPVYPVTLQDYYIGKCEVTQGLWEAVMGTSVMELRDRINPYWTLRGVGSDYPMYYVSWDEAQKFCVRLSELTGKKYVLPTEAQWEYAARGGAKGKGYRYSGSDNIDDVAWYGEDNKTASSHPVGTKHPNELGIYDMSGNVWEWCNKYSDEFLEDPTGFSSNFSRVLRGGSWRGDTSLCLVSSRINNNPDSRFNGYGFRVVLIP